MKEDDTYEGVVIERLPTIGEAYSMKTISQGRVGNIYENCMSEPLLVRKGRGRVAIGHRSLRADNTATLVFNANRIIKFKHATPRQVALAVKLLGLIESKAIFANEAKTVFGITRSLSKKHKDF
jgi:hypothetical protein